jgi:acyl-coenzyme A thioesterase PaaI-like protein
MAFAEFQKTASNPILFGLFMLMKLPSAFFCGVRLRSITPQKAVVSVPYKWFSQNPFRSIYFACQAMAAEMSTGVLALGHLHGQNPSVSMLVTSLQAQYFKKATERIYFTCDNGDQILQAIAKAIETGTGQTVQAVSQGKTAQGELVSTFIITWSFKVKK